MNKNFDEIKRELKEDVANLVFELWDRRTPPDDILDMVDDAGDLSNLIDVTIPVYNGEIMSLACHGDLFYHEVTYVPPNELLINVVRNAIYEELEIVALDEVKRLIAEIKEDMAQGTYEHDHDL